MFILLVFVVTEVQRDVEEFVDCDTCGFTDVTGDSVVVGSDEIIV